MKKLIISICALAVLLLSGCTSPNLAEKIDMTVSIDTPTIILSSANFLKQKAKITYSITNQSAVNLTQEKYELVLGLGRESSLSYTVLQFLKKEVAAGQTVTGTYEHLFEQVLGADGKHEIRFVLSEKDGEYSRPIKTSVAPVDVQYK